MGQSARIRITQGTLSAIVTVSEEHWALPGPSRPWQCSPAGAIGPAGLSGQYWESPTGSATGGFLIPFWANVPGRGSIPALIFRLDFTPHVVGVVGTGLGPWPFRTGQTGDGRIHAAGGTMTGRISYEVL